MSRLRSYARMGKRSQKVTAAEPDFRRVYAAVDLRSDGRCEVVIVPTPLNWPVDSRCPRRATDHHHLVKPRRQNHAADKIVHVCRGCHDRMDWPYARGRFCFLAAKGGRFIFRVLFASSKFALRGQGQ